MNLSPQEIKEKFGYDFVSEFSEGLACASQSGKWFHIWSNGKPAYKGRYEKVIPFSQGLARVYKNKRWYYIRTDGMIIHFKNKKI